MLDEEIRLINEKRSSKNTPDSLEQAESSQTKIKEKGKEKESDSVEQDETSQSKNKGKDKEKKKEKWLETVTGTRAVIAILGLKMGKKRGTRNGR